MSLSFKVLLVEGQSCEWTGGRYICTQWPFTFGVGHSFEWPPPPHDGNVWQKSQTCTSQFLHVGFCPSRNYWGTVTDSWVTFVSGCPKIFLCRPGRFLEKKACLNFLEIQLSFRCPIFKVHHLQILASSIQVKSTHLVKANCSFCLNKLWISVQSVLLHGHWYMIHCLVTLSRTKRHLITDDKTEGLQGFSEFKSFLELVGKFTSTG